ncbi:GspE/PulE family protein [Acinetobacter bereziniae]|uniref:GspE/PulE family protein n=1 Tax=Acinetobacter bereziniae TaxID=106648 RepID=UPI00124FF979|nr:GspE/PulE family protein [Acinetobacter bereziniae]
MSLVKHWFKREHISSLQPDFEYINQSLAVQQQCFAGWYEKQLWVVFLREPNFNDLAWLSYAFDQEFQIGQVPSDELSFYSFLISDTYTKAPVQLMSETTPQKLTPENTDNPVIQLVNQVLMDAYQKGASDIHFENTIIGLVIKSRIDGVLVETKSLSERTVAEHIISRLKVLAELDIAERRIPQDGRLSVRLEGHDVDLRISIMPGLHGEDAVLRILDKKALTQNDEPLNLELLGFDSQTMHEIRQLALQPYGMMLVTGPTGSGKTTTLYALLYEQHDGQQKIITIEDPVEYQIKGTLQIPVNEKKGLTFARGLRSILRHDPDKILVGEIRDHETADIAVQAALTGHLVYTSVHANHALDVIGRFRHMEIDLFGFVSSLNGIIAQRLIRLNCTACKKPIKYDSKLLEYSGIQKPEINQYDFYQGEGCDHCQGTGYKGRQAIAEVLIMTDELRELMIQGVPIGQIRKVLQTQGMRFLRQQALAVVAAGNSTLQEINRVTFVER